MAGVEVWFQRASDVVRKLISGDVDMGIVGYDMVQEYGEVSGLDMVEEHGDAMRNRLGRGSKSQGWQPAAPPGTEVEEPEIAAGSSCNRVLDGRPSHDLHAASGPRLGGAVALLCRGARTCWWSTKPWDSGAAT